MAKLLLDSDILIYFLNGKAEVIEQFSRYKIDDLVISRINYAELLFGVYNSSKVAKNINIVLPFLENFKVFEFDQDSAVIFAKEKTRLKKAGTPITDMDLMIAAIAIANELTLVTNNIKHFKRIKLLNLECWV